MSWQNSLQYMRNVIDDPEIPGDVQVAVEYQIPRTSKRVDFMIGNDLRFDPCSGKVITDPSKISKDDKSSGIRSADPLSAERLIKNTYKTLLTRGQKGCYIYCEDEALASYIRSALK